MMIFIADVITLDAGGAIEITPGMMMAAAIIAFMAGLVSCFLGYRLLNLLLGLTGFVAGWLAGSAGGAAVGGSMTWAVLGGLAGGVICAVLFVFLLLPGLFAMGGLLGWLLGGFVAAMWKDSLYPALPAILAAIMGITVLIFRRFIIIAATSFVGSWAVMSGGFYLLAEDKRLPMDVLQLPEVGYQKAMMLGIWIGVGLMGMVVQYMATAPEEAGGPRGRDKD